MKHPGQCLCGDVRFAIEGDPGVTLCCHCRDCQRASAAPFMVWTLFRVGDFSLEQGELRTVHVEGRERTFCPRCGTHVTFADPAQPHELEVATVLLENPLSPVQHEWMEDAVDWLVLDDDLPKYERGP